MVYNVEIKSRQCVRTAPHTHTHTHTLTLCSVRPHVLHDSYNAPFVAHTHAHTTSVALHSAFSHSRVQMNELVAHVCRFIPATPPAGSAHVRQHSCRLASGRRRSPEGRCCQFPTLVCACVCVHSLGCARTVTDTPPQTCTHQHAPHARTTRTSIVYNLAPGSDSV